MVEQDVPIEWHAPQHLHRCLVSVCVLVKGLAAGHDGLIARLGIKGDDAILEHNEPAPADDFGPRAGQEVVLNQRRVAVCLSGLQGDVQA